MELICFVQLRELNTQTHIGERKKRKRKKRKKKKKNFETQKESLKYVPDNFDVLLPLMVIIEMELAQYFSDALAIDFQIKKFFLN